MSSPTDRPMQAARALAVAAALAAAPLATAHGHAAYLDVGPVEGIAVQGRYDDGSAMAGAQIAVFAPDDPARPWLTGVADEAGWFRFVPDPALAGRWTIQARQAGHGAMAHVDLGQPGEATVVRLTSSGNDAPSPLQRGLMAAAVVWGAIGTALFFRRRRTD